MHLMYFTEQPMSAYDAAEGLEYGATALIFSNSNFDPVAGSRLYNQYLEDYVYAEECGADGIMLNEHHNAPFCMQAKCNVFAVHPRRHHEAGEDRVARQSAAARRKSRAASRRTRDDRHDLQGPAGVGLRAWRRPGAARDRRQSRIQSRTVRGSARSDRQGLDPAWAVPLGRHALPAPRGQSLGCSAAEALSARVDSRCAFKGNRYLGGAPPLPLYRPQHLGRRHAVRSGTSTPNRRPMPATSPGRKTSAT